jgi:phosphatidylglycerol:prolipoprotein diacylglycerol transferase
MHPVIGHLGPLTIYSFGLMLAIAVVVCSFLLSRDAKKFGISQEVIFDFAFWVILAGIVGSRLFFIFLNLGDFIADPRQIIMISNGGLAWQGGLIVGGLTGLLFIKTKKLSLRLMADLAAPYLALGQAIGRIGCFLNGCCYGREVSWGIYCPVHDAHLHPTQLYESAYLLIVFFILKYLQKNSVIRGEIFALYLIFAAVGRFTNEFFRADHVNTAVGLSVFQLVSLGVFLVGLYFWRRLRRTTQVRSS